MLERVGLLSSARPRRTLLIVLAFVVLAGAVGGPLAGQLDSGGGLTPGDAESSRADQLFQRATGEQSAPGVVLLVRGDRDGLAERVDATADQLAGVRGVVRADEAAVTQNGALVTGTLSADVDDDEVAEAALAAFEDERDVTVGGSAVANLQLSETISEDLGRAEMLAFPLLLVLSLLFFAAAPHCCRSSSA